MRRVILLCSILVAAAVGTWWHISSPQMRRPAGALGRGTDSVESKIENQKSKIDGDDPSPSHLADALNSPQGDIHRDLQIVSEVLSAYRSNFPHDGNPWGDNEEITAQLTGRNRLKLSLIATHHPAINRAGELCDRWGTPFFFHALDRAHMAIRSAGPDRKMWTADDVALEP